MKYPLIPDISRKIEKVLEKLKLKPLILPQRFIEKTKGEKHRYSSVCLDKQGNKLIFYARLRGTDFEKNRMRTEVLIAKEIIKKGGLEIIPRYFQAQIVNDDFEWLTREYFPYPVLELKREIEKLRKKISKEGISRIVKGIYELNHSFLSEFPFLKKFNIGGYLNCGNTAYSLQKEGVLEKEECDKLNKFLKENEKLLAKENRYFCHGDFQIGNIILSGKKVKIIDLESAHINNFCFDISFMFSRLWRETKTRKSLIKIYFESLPEKEKLIFPNLFRIDTFFNACHNFRTKPLEYNENQIKERRDFAKKLMKSAIKEFESLQEI